MESKNHYTIKFDKNLTDSVPVDGIMDDIDCVYDQDYVLTTNTFKKTANIFTGWNTEADGSAHLLQMGKPLKNLTTVKDGVVTLYAQWDPQAILSSTLVTEVLLEVCRLR